MQGGQITRAEVLARAVSWVQQRVPYSQSRWWRDANGRYRQDCSGYVSMAWNLSQRSNYWTGNLGTVSSRIPSSALKPGDILNLPRKHVVIFGGWANLEKTRFNLYEQYATGRTPRYALNASLAYYLNRGYGAYRYRSILDNALELPPVLSNADGTEDTISLVAATATVPPAGEQWTPESAAAYESEPEAPPAPSGAATPSAVADLPVASLVAAQRALDDAVLEAGRQALVADSTGSELLAAGVVLLLLAFPLGVTVRAGVSSPAAGRSGRASDVKRD